jgi:hypothetical protein
MSSLSWCSLEDVQFFSFHQGSVEQETATGGNRRYNSPVGDHCLSALGALPEVSLGSRPRAEARRTVF